MNIEKKISIEEMVLGAIEMSKLRNEYHETIASLTSKFSAIKSRILDVTNSSSPLLSMDESEFIDHCKVGLWRKVFLELHLFDGLTKADRDSLEKKIVCEKKPFSEENLNKLVSQANRIREEGAYRAQLQVYSSFFACAYNSADDGYGVDKKRDNLQKIEKQFRVCGTELKRSYSGWSRFEIDTHSSHKGSRYLDDLLMICNMLAGKEHNYASNFYFYAQAKNGGVYEGSYTKDKNGIVATPYFTVQPYLNGNVKVTFTDMKILQEFNRTGGDSSMLPDSVRKRYKQEDRFKTDGSSMEIDFDAVKDYSDLNFYETPESVGRELARMIGVETIRNAETILEPSAGERSLIYAIEAEIKQKDGSPKTWDVYEIDNRRADILEHRGHTRLIGRDFLKHKFLKYDVIAMNPPFSGNRDVVHVLKAFEYLNEGGTLGAIMSPHWRYASDKISRDFRAFVSNNSVAVKTIPAGAFKDSGTMIETVIVILQKKYTTE